MPGPEQRLSWVTRRRWQASQHPAIPNVTVALPVTNVTVAGPAPTVSVTTPPGPPGVVAPVQRLAWVGRHRWQIGGPTAPPPPPVTVSLPVGQVTVSAPVPLVTAGDTVYLTAGNVAVAGPAPTVSVTTPPGPPGLVGPVQRLAWVRRHRWQTEPLIPIPPPVTLHLPVAHVTVASYVPAVQITTLDIGGRGSPGSITITYEVPTGLVDAYSGGNYTDPLGNMVGAGLTGPISMQSPQTGLTVVEGWHSAGVIVGSQQDPVNGVYRGPCGIRQQNGVVTTAGAGISAYQTWLGSQVTYALDYMNNTPSTWAQFTGVYLYGATLGYNYLSQWNLPPGMILCLGLSACSGGSIGSGGTTWQAESTGTNDSYWTTLGNNLVGWGFGNALLRIGREFNYAGYTWSPSTTGDTESQYIAGYQHVVSLLRNISPYFSFMWNPALSPGTMSGQSGGALETQNWYPGDGYVDSIGLDVYDWGDYSTLTGMPYTRTTAQQTTNWNFLETAQDGLNSWLAFAATHGKPLAFPEWGNELWLSGSNYYGGGDDAYYCAQMYNWMYSHPTLMQAMWEDDGMGLFDTDTFGSRQGGIVVPNSRAQFLSNFGGAGSYSGVNGLYYRLTSENEVELIWQFATVGPSGYTVCILPSRYIPRVSQNIRTGWTGTGPGGYVSGFDPHLAIDTNGHIMANGLSNCSSLTLFGQGKYTLDGTL